MGKVFINYRRDVSKDAARHLASLLAAQLDTPLDRLRGRSRVFIDLKSLDGFSEWFAVLKEQVAGSAAMISVIGPGWLEARDKESGKPRLEDEDDFVRVEIRDAISRRIPVLPVLLDGAELPSMGALPADMRGLLAWQSMRLSSSHFERDAKQIARQLRKYLPRPSGVSPSMAVAVTLAGLVAGVVAGRYWWPPGTLPADVVALSKALMEAQRERDTATTKLANADRAVSDIKGRLREAEDTLAAAKSEASALKDVASRGEAARKTAETAGQNADAARKDVEVKLAAANATLAEATNRVETLRRELEQKSEMIASLADIAARGGTFHDCWRDGGQEICGPQMVVIPQGTFLMGSPNGEEGRDDDEAPQHLVAIAMPFAMGQFEVTFAQWDACVAARACKHKPADQGWGRGDLPVIDVSWSDVTGEYLPWLSKTTGKTYRLLTEAEWEYAARAGTTEAFSFNGKISVEKANYDATIAYDNSARSKSRQQTVPVKSFRINPWGLYQMHGNVWEWLQDCKTDYKDTPRDGSSAPTAKSCPRVVRGGSWSNDPQELRSANRLGVEPGDRARDIGFRVARTLAP